MADELLDWAEEPLARGGQRRSVRALREEINRRLERIPTRSFSSIEPTKAAVALTISPAPEPETSEYAVLPLPAVPRFEPKVQQQFGDQASEGSSTDREAKGVALAGIYAALRKPITADLREQLQQCLRILDPS